MKIEIFCDGQNINTFMGHEWGNPFVELPQVGDFIELGEHNLKNYEQQPMKKYRVVSRTFSAIRTYNLQYMEQKCVLKVDEVRPFL